MKKPNGFQEKAMGQIVADNIGSNFQTGYYGDGWFYIHAQKGPDAEVKYHYIDLEGTVIPDSPFAIPIPKGWVLPPGDFKPRFDKCP